MLARTPLSSCHPPLTLRKTPIFTIKTPTVRHQIFPHSTSKTDSTYKKYTKKHKPLSFKYKKRLKVQLNTKQATKRYVRVAKKKKWRRSVSASPSRVHAGRSSVQVGRLPYEEFPTPTSPGAFALAWAPRPGLHPPPRPPPAAEHRWRPTPN